MNKLQKAIEFFTDYLEFCKKNKIIASGKRMYETAIAALQEKMKYSWIPCGERLPEAGKSVLICGETGYQAVAWFEDGIWWKGFCLAEILDDVVAWMPLPEPYEPQ